MKYKTLQKYLKPLKSVQQKQTILQVTKVHLLLNKTIQKQCTYCKNEVLWINIWNLVTFVFIISLTYQIKKLVKIFLRRKILKNGLESSECLTDCKFSTCTISSKQEVCFFTGYSPQSNKQLFWSMANLGSHVSLFKIKW